MQSPIDELAGAQQELSSAGNGGSGGAAAEDHNLQEKQRKDVDGAVDKAYFLDEIAMMKERFSKLLLGEDMSGGGKGVCSALAISNAITNLCATIFGQLWRLEPLSPHRKSMWRREMDWLLCAGDHIVEFAPSRRTFSDGSELEVMTCRQRSDIYMNLPALRKLDNMLIEVLDGFKTAEFWYVDRGKAAPDASGGGSPEEKWWLPTPRVPPGGLGEKSRKQLQTRRDCTSQILKAAMAINGDTLAEMEVPESYLDSLPRSGRASLGENVYRFVASDRFSPERLLDRLGFVSEHEALEVADRAEAALHAWRHRAPGAGAAGWGIVREMTMDSERRETLAGRAESLLLCLKRRFPGLAQTTLDTSKIQFNKDVGKAILESYSRVLESLAFNILSRIDELLQADDFAKGGAVHNGAAAAAASLPSITFVTAYATPASFLGPARVERSPCIGREVHGAGINGAGEPPAPRTTMTLEGR